MSYLDGGIHGVDWLELIGSLLLVVVMGWVICYFSVVFFFVSHASFVVWIINDPKAQPNFCFVFCGRVVFWFVRMVLS